MAGSEITADKLRSIPQIRVILEALSQETLFDAAYLLYRQKSTLTMHERDAGLHPPSPEVDLSTWAATSKLIRSTYARLVAEREVEHLGPSFYRLKAAHPDAADDDVRSAIRAVVKLEKDLMNPGRTFSTGNHWKDTEDWVRWALDMNPGFSEATFQRLLNDTILAYR
jgi:hypothetical protein